MKKVLIISYFFPPGNFAGSFRVKSWADHFHKSGYYPVIITRHWDENETDFTAISSEKEVKKEEHKNYTVYRLPFKGTVRDRLVKRFGKKAVFPGRLFSFFQVIGQNYFLKSIPYANLYHFSREYLEENPDIKLVIVSGRPFQLFRFAWLLKKEFPYIKWIADYRDPWNTNPVAKQSFKMRFFSFMERNLEKEWLSNAQSFISCSDLWIKQIGKFVKKPGVIILNGFEKPGYAMKKTLEEKFRIVYNGTLYSNQPVEIFIEGFKIFNEKNPTAKVQLIFSGAASDNSIFRLKSLTEEVKGKVSILKRRKQSEAFSLMKSAQVCLSINYKGERGRFSAKVFDYLSAEKPIILCPGDNDVIEGLIRETGAGYIADSAEEAAGLLQDLYEEWKNTGTIKWNGNREVVKNYSREVQAAKLCKLLDKISNDVWLTECPVCKSLSFRRLREYSAKHLVKCSCCNFVFAEKDPSETEILDYYREYSYSSPVYVSPITIKRYGKLLDTFEKYRKNGRLLDAGCGSGVFLDTARKRGWEVWGTEISEEAVKTCREKGLNVIQGKLVDLSERLPEFDVITSFEVIEHTNKPDEEVKAFSDLMRKGGLLYITTPNWNSLMRRMLKSNYDVISYPEHLSYFTSVTLRRLLRKNGFKIKKMETTGFSFSRFKNSYNRDNKRESPFTAESTDEKIRKVFASGPAATILKVAIDKLFSVSRSGLSLKAYFFKK